MTNEPEFIYGYGKTKHLPAPGSTMWGRQAGLCGAPGGYPMDAPHRPLCKHCERKARAVSEGTPQSEGNK